MAYQLYKGDTPLATFIPQIADNLTTNDSTKALSAKQGKVLNEKTASDIDYSSGVSVKQKIDEKATQNKYTNLNITNSIGGAEANKAMLRASGEIGFCSFSYICQNSSSETLTISLPTGWYFQYGGIIARDSANGNLVTLWASNNNVSSYLHTGTMVVGHDYKLCVPCFKL